MTCLLYENRISSFSDTPQLNSDQAASIVMLSRPTRAIITDQFYLGRIVACNSAKESIAIACNPLIGWIHSNEDES
jgi:hypothetical protein